MLTVKHLRHLNAILKHQTIHAAAESLFLTQSALTRSLGTMEDALGVTLFERSKQGMTPTPFCLKIAEQSEQVVLEMDDIKREADIYRDLDDGELRISVGRALRGLVLEKTIPSFVRRYPKIRLTINEALPHELVQQLLQRETDILIGGAGSYQNIPGIKYRRLCDIPLFVVVAADHPLAEMRNVDIEDLLGFPMIMATEIAADHPLMGFFNHPDQYQPILTCSDYSTLKQVLKVNQSWLVAPEYYFEDEWARGEFARLSLGSSDPKNSLSVIELEKRSRTPAAQAFVEICEEVFSGVIED